MISKFWRESRQPMKERNLAAKVREKHNKGGTQR